MFYPKKILAKLLEWKQDHQTYMNGDRVRASLMSMTYSDPAVAPDHTVHIPGHRITVHSTKEKAHQKLLSMGFKPYKDEEMKDTQ